MRGWWLWGGWAGVVFHFQGVVLKNRRPTGEWKFFFPRGGGGSSKKVCTDLSSPLPGHATFIRRLRAPSKALWLSASQGEEIKPPTTQQHKLNPPLFLPPVSSTDLNLHISFLSNFSKVLFFSTTKNQSWHKLPLVAFKDPARSSMKEAVRQQVWGKEMSATVLSAFYDMDMLYKVKKKKSLTL